MSFTSIFKANIATADSNPYIGPRAFQSGEPIYGRERESRQLVNLIVAERIVLLYSPSGAGKTSLIQAAIMPQLQKMKFQVLPVVRVNLDAGVDGQAINRYVYSAMLSLEEGIPLEQRSKPEALAEKSLAEYLDAYPKIEGGRGIEVLLFDQFEEILTLNPADQAAKQAFFQQVGEALDAPKRWALFSMREDYVAALDPYLMEIPSRFRTTYRLDLLGSEAARQAIQQPARNAGVEFEDEAAGKLVDDLRRVRVQQPDGSLLPQLGPYVEPVQLQVVCYRLWQGKRLYAERITTEDLSAYGEVEQSLVDRSLGQYYAQSVQEASAKTGMSERAIREWVDHYLVTESGVRGTVVMGQERSGGLDNRAIWSLVDAHLVRGEKRGGATWFELAHDRLLAPVRESNAAWRTLHLSLLQQGASLWVAQGRAESLLLSRKNLAEAERWGAENEGELLAIEKEFLEASRKLEGRERRARLLNRLIAVLGVLAIMLAGVAFSFYVNAQRQAKIARSGQLAAQAQAGLELYPIRSLLLAIEANSANAQGEIRSAAAQEALRAAVKDPHGWYLYGAYGAVTETAFSLDGRWLATGSEDGMAHLYDMESIEPGDTPEYWLEHDSPVRAMAFDPEGRWLSTGYKDGTARLWDLQAENPEVAPIFLLGHSETITSMEFSPDGRWLATGSLDGTARVWDLEAGNLVTDSIVLTCPDGGVEALAFTPDSLLLATASSSIVRLWAFQAENPSENPRSRGFEGFGVRALAISQDGRWLASGGGSFIWLWDLEADSSKFLSDFTTVQDQGATSLVFSPNGEWVASGGRGGLVRLWALDNIEEGVDPILLLGHEKRINRIAFSPDGRWLASGSADHGVRLWDLYSANPVETPVILPGHDGGVNTLAFSPDGRWLATGGEDEAARLWELPALSGEANPVVLKFALKNVEDASPEISALGFSPDGKWLVRAKQYGLIIQKWDEGGLNPAGSQETYGEHGALVSGSRITALASSPDGRWLATGNRDHSVKLWDLHDNDPTATAILLEGHEDQVSALAFSPDGRWLASGGWDTTIRLWNLQTPDPDLDVKVLEGHNGIVNALAFSPDGRWLASGSGDNEARVWYLSAADPGADAIILSGHEDDIFALAFSPDSAWLATASGDETVRLWEIRAFGPSGESIVLRGHENQVHSLAFSPDGRWLVTGSWDETARLWDMRSPRSAEAAFVLRGHKDWINSLAISPDSRWLATGSSDQSVRLWDLKAGNPAAISVALTGFEGAVDQLAFSPGGGWLAGGGGNSYTRLWLVNGGDLRRLACRNAGRNLTAEEWLEFFPGESYRKTCEEWTDTPP